MKRTSTVLAVSWALSLVLACAPTSSRDRDGDTLSILFTGDVLLDRGVRPTIEKRGIGYLFAEVEPFFRQADAVVINLECPMTDSVTPVNKQFIFRADSRWASEMRDVGITHAALANNHTIDQGRTGLRATCRHLEEAGIVPLGYGDSASQQLSPLLIAKGDMRVALFNALAVPLENWHHTEGHPDICQPTAEQLEDAVCSYHKSHPETKIVVVLHWGTEYQPQPSIRQRRMAARLAEAGADAIIGHHPHVLQPIDTIGHTLVFYSLGNFVFDQRQPQTQQTMMVRLSFHPDASLNYDTIPVQIRQNRPTPVR